MLTLVLALTPAMPPVAPSARSGFTLAHDPGRAALVLHGGQSGDASLSDTWTFDGERWSELTFDGEGPGDRLNAALAHDGKRLVLFGGARDRRRMGDTWGLTEDGWVQLAPESEDGPERRTLCDMAFDEKRGKLVLFGGKARAALGDTWEWDPDATSWTRVASEGPSPRGAHEMCYHPGRETVVLYGGYGEGALGELWEWNGERWRLVETKPADGEESPASPGPRLHFALGHDAGRGELVLYGGFGETERQGDTWTFDGQGWSGLATDAHAEPAGPRAEPIGPRAEHDGAWLPGVGFVVFGGVRGQELSFDARDRSADTWILEPSGWREFTAPAAEDE